MSVEPAPLDTAADTGAFVRTIGNTSDVAVAQIRTEGDLKKAEMVQTSDMKELELKLLMAREDREFQREMKQMSLNIEMVKLAQTKELTLDQIKAKLADSSMKERNKKELYNAEASLRVSTGAGI